MLGGRGGFAVLVVREWGERACWPVRRLPARGGLAGQEYAQRIQAVLEYDPQPPFGAMAWELADTDRYWARIGGQAEQGAWFSGLLEGRPDLQERLA